MKRYIIDSDILIYFLKGKKEIVNKLLQIPSNNLFTTRINYAELKYGAYNSSRIEENLIKVDEFLKNFTILEFDELSSNIFAKTKAYLKKKGKIIQDMDLMIASIAIRNNYILVTNNIKHFKRIDNLELIEWL